jgi:hypothetical protein
MRCACSDLFALEGAAVRSYAEEHLEKMSVDPVAWTTTYRCPETGRTWLLDHPHGELQGGGPPRLRQLDEHGVPIEGGGTDPYR